MLLYIKNFKIMLGKSIKEDTKLGILCNHEFVSTRNEYI